MKNNTDQSSKAKVKPTKTTRNYTKKSGVSTRDVILDEASKIINRTGVVDFRIEALASSLKLSPGNITYHFPKKEDIISAIWEQYMFNLATVTDQLLTPLLDIKQLFLYYRTTAFRTFDKLGVAVYHFGDMGMLTEDSEMYREHVVYARKMMLDSYKILARNGYMKEIKDEYMAELVFQSQFLMLRWWFNHAMKNCKSTDDIAGQVDRYIAMAIYPLVPHLTAEGKSQFESILKVIA